uniref:Zinc finger RING-type eukaryotic domain-containing protein n=1 Tax=Gopherus agassizii TaxID=38772 RepID=A0A452IIC1_9SAUR
MAENWKNCFEEELICPICLHVFVEPVQLPCNTDHWGFGVLSVEACLAAWPGGALPALILGSRPCL